ncbi:hypothetical protein R3P38DRAFT_3345232 [Favolaschia claudopus]|uniref:Uncharacterized protein n=1 Tax=Favolaschia claudopus TaxID=2862362 RepID=A0AAW0D8I0_9AGAR
MGTGGLSIPGEYKDLEVPINAAHTLRLTVSAFMNDPTLPLDPLYANLEPCQFVLARHPNLHSELKEGHANGDFSKLRNHPALRCQPRAAEFAESVSKILPAITEFIENEGPDIWLPKTEQAVGQAIHTHIASLAVPSVGRTPSVLLRNLGQFVEDDPLAQRIDNIFMKGKHTFLVNASGSGKTRLAFEGLCQQWGLYMVGAVDLNGIGSTDISSILHTYIKHSREGFCLAVSSSSEEISRNLKITRACLRKLLLCRLIVFSVFLEHIHVAGMKPEHKKLWLLLQSLPRTLKGAYFPDIFSKMLRQISGMDDDYIKDYNAFLLHKLRRLFGGDFHLFVVIDEAQVFFESYSMAYRNADGTYYPILREIVDALNDEFSQHEVSFVIAGTDIPRADFQQSRHIERHRWCSDTGVFEDEDAHRRYVAHYLPPAYAKTAGGQAFLRRMWEWCRGRHRITDSLMATLLQRGFKSPHTLLNEHVEMATGYRPKLVIDTEFADEEEPDSDEFMISSVDCNILALQFNRPSASNSHLVSAIRDSLFHHCVVAGPPPPLDNDLIALVSTGFARFSDPNMSQIMLDEPLLLLAAANWLYKRPLDEFLVEREDSLLDILQQSLTSLRVYPASLVLYLSRVFAANPRVHEVFTFPGSKPKWANKRAEIVSLGSVEPGYASVDLTSEVLAAAPSSLEDTVSWLANETLSLPPFCLGQSRDSPDIMFGLRLEDGTLKRVVVHTSLTTSNLRGDPLRKVINDFSDDTLFKDDDDSTVHDHAIAALHDIPKTAKGPRKSSILRVFASFPGTLRLGDVTHAPNLAQLNNAKFSKIVQSIPASSIFEQIVKSVTLQLGKPYPSSTYCILTRILAWETKLADYILWSDMSEGSFDIPPEYADLDDPVNAAKALRVIVIAFRHDEALPLDPLYANLKPCKLILSRHPDLYAALKEGRASGKFQLLRSHQALRLQKNALKFTEMVSKTRADLLQFLEGGRVDAWAIESESVTEEIKLHIASLQLPNIGGMPSVLLRDLGRFSEDALLSRRVNNIFAKEQHTFLVNASGSGKTRLTFEGLCRNWGLYLVGAIDANRIGSSDLPDLLESSVAEEGFVVDVSMDTEERSRNIELTCRCLRKLLLCRLLVLSIFAEHISSVGIQPEHLKQWLLLQAVSGMLKERALQDVFSALLVRTVDTDDAHTRDYIAFVLGKLRKLFGPEFHLFIVIDEAQVILDHHSSAFRDQNGTPYTILREIVDGLDAEFHRHEVSFVISGTEIPKADFQNSRNIDLHRWCSDTGAFDDEDRHRKYVTRLMPPKYIQTTAGQAFLRRVWEWCRGRYRVTDTLMATLIRDGFQSPHTLLSDYVERATGSRTKHNQDFVAEESDKRESILISEIDCGVLSWPAYTELQSTLLETSFVHLVTTRPSPPLSVDHISVVTRAFGRFIDKQMSELVVDEPVFIIALAKWFTNRVSSLPRSQRQDSLLDVLKHFVTNYQVPPAALALCLSLAFSQGLQVCKAFTFPGPDVPPWAEKTANIVMLGGEAPGYAVANLTSGSLAEAPSSLEGIISWLKSDTLSPTPFCLGQFAGGPNLMFGLRLEDGTLIRIVLNRCAPMTVTEMRDESDPVKAMLKKLDDKQLFKCDDPDMRDRAVTALHALPAVDGAVPKPFVLRVLAAFPGIIGLSSVPQRSTQNLAQLNSDLLRTIAEKTPASLMFERIVEAVTLQVRDGKRKRPIDQSFEESRKRAKPL